MSGPSYQHITMALHLAITYKRHCHYPSQEPAATCYRNLYSKNGIVPEIFKEIHVLKEPSYNLRNQENVFVLKQKN